MTDGIQFVFMNVSGNGNNLYLDNILIEPNYDVKPPGDLRISQFSTSSAELTLRWSDRSNNESQFVVERAQGDGEFVEHGVVEANKTFFRDQNIEGGYQYRYRVYAKGREGFNSPASNEVATDEFILTALNPDHFKDEISLFPNPFNNEINLKVNGAKPGQVEVLIANALGQEVDCLLFNKQEAILQEKIFLGDGLKSGIYFVRLSFEGYQKSVILIKN